ncbi:MoaD/ThiS family protein [Ruegeria pomeroyi]|uniref:MoaD/ThiS family protein n=2 Tax=Ruegeria TaxID=97050 RepID=A0A9Q3WC97_9RHOB|nr:MULTISPECIES: MoaD/ThiS family protein [Ruegeria]MCE8509670.1 MoaD/ThiS family protein [Ruegeria pomeroyi]MCE8514442.1 MoaD/ThiS family protein [Ruegeria pomeroyi]MCE8516687.1 MoaD/ThiS family protein [Ruegeria pomeroyi]MCE8523012.1 MoaD/ThiS family protein [Ruegeria pomeroyi]MCE8525553.1 MoaD/ThiS family protein [Ruegeria pomeroyi]
MVEVHLWSGLRSLAGGCEVVSVEARDTGEMLRALVRAHPELQAPIDAGVSVAIDGRVIASGLTEPIPDGAEVYLMQRLRGG